MHILIYVLVVCASAGLCASHVLINRANGLGDTAFNILLNSDIEKPDNTINSLDIMLEYVYRTDANNIVTLKRFKRSFIGTANCPENTVRISGSCVKCDLYEEITDLPCPIKNQ